MTRGSFSTLLGLNIVGQVLSVYGSSCSWNVTEDNIIYNIDLSPLDGTKFSHSCWTNNGVTYDISTKLCGDHLTCDGKSAFATLSNTTCFGYLSYQDPTTIDVSSDGGVEWKIDGNIVTYGDSSCDTDNYNFDVCHIYTCTYFSISFFACCVYESVPIFDFGNFLA